MSIIDELIEEGVSKGLSQGMSKGAAVIKFWLKGMSIPAIAEKLDLSIVDVQKAIDYYESDN